MNSGGGGNRTRIPAMRPRCTPIIRRPLQSWGGGSIAADRLSECLIVASMGENSNHFSLRGGFSGYEQG